MSDNVFLELEETYYALELTDDTEYPYYVFPVIGIMFNNGHPVYMYRKHATIEEVDGSGQGIVFEASDTDCADLMCKLRSGKYFFDREELFERDFLEMLQYQKIGQ